MSMIRVLIMPLIFVLMAIMPIRVNTATLTRVALGFWLIGGLMLCWVGAGRLTDAVNSGVDVTGLTIALAMAAGVGVMKGRFILGKTAHKNIERLNALEGPQKLIHVYSIRSWIVLTFMLLLSAAMTWFNVDHYWRGIVNMAVGIALIMSTQAYFQAISTAASKDPSSSTP